MYKAVLKCSQLSKSFRQGKVEVPVFRDVDLAVTAGELVAILGPSGTGKSTLLHLLGGLERPSTGQVWICEQELLGLSESGKGYLRNRYLGFIYQFHHLLPEFTALENVSIPLLIRGGLSVKTIHEKAMALLSKVGLAHRVKHRIGELSGGERQRVAIARALITEPACVLADEPTGNLDHKTAEQVYALMLKLNKELQTSFIVVTHDISLAERMDKTFTLLDGSLLEGNHR